MTSITNNPAEPTLINARAVLTTHLQRADRRGRALRLSRFLLFSIAALIANLFLLAVIDAWVPMVWWLRAVLLGLILLITLAGLAWFVLLRLIRSDDGLASAERIDEAGHTTDQPVVRAASLLPTDEDDPLYLRLRERAESRAASLAESTKPKVVYPLRSLRPSTGTFTVALGFWLIFGAMFPSQFANVFGRVVMPWASHPPFTLTELDPTWQPDEPMVGDNITVSVAPKGLATDAVDFVRLDEDGNEADRFAMSLDREGTFHHTLIRVEEPIAFVLETRGRPTRVYRIEPLPTPEPYKPEDQGDVVSGGTTSFDPETIALIKRNAHADWPELRERIDNLLAGLAQAQNLAETIDPSNADDAQAFAQLLQDLTAQAKALSGDLQAMQGELPPDAAQSLADLIDALADLKVSPLAQGPSTEGTSTQSQASADWLKQAGEAAGSDRASVSEGLGRSDVPTPNGTAGSSAGTDKPEFTDPAASGVYDQQGTSANQGVLPPAVMQRVPPSYREHIRAYFNKLTETDNAANN